MFMLIGVRRIPLEIDRVELAPAVVDAFRCESWSSNGTLLVERNVVFLDR